MLHDCHELYSVVAEVLDAWKDRFGELLVSCNLGVRRGYADVGFIDASAERLWWLLMLERVALIFWGIPEPCVVHRGHIQVLSDSSDPGWQTFLSGMIIGHNERDLELVISQLAVASSPIYFLTLTLESWAIAGEALTAGRTISKTPKLSFFISWESRFQLSGLELGPPTKVPFAMFLTEIANEIGAQGIWGPLSVDNVSIWHDVEAVLFITLRSELATVCRWICHAQHTLLNFSRPPSVSLMVLIQC